MKNIGKIKDVKVTKLIKSILIGLSFLLIGCESPYKSLPEDGEVELLFDMRLSKDDNGYYHLNIDTTKWQTIHRVSGSILKNEYGVENFRVEWSSNLYWYLGDTLGYIVKRGLTDNLEYVSYDTVYITGFNGMEVSTSNLASYSNSEGEINNMIAPVRSMKGDTMTLTADWYGVGWDKTSANFHIVLD